MKTSLKKLLNPHLHLKRNTKKDTRTIQPLANIDELAKASQAMQDMRDCYDSLLSSAAAATNSAFEFSESLREMGVCLLQNIALNDDEESGKVMLMLGKAQFELQRIVDVYRNHIFQTITVPSESLLNELNTVEEMKHQCDEKRDLYEYMKTNYCKKGRNKSEKGQTFSLQQLHEAKKEFDEEATLLAFRLKSLKQGQSRSLLTQAARHHSAQLSFFRNGLKSLEAVDPHVKLVTQQQHIDYQSTDIKDEESEEGEGDDGSDEDDYSSTSCVEDNEELRYQCNGRQLSFVSTARHPMEGNLKNSHGDSYKREQKMLSQSAPLFSQQKIEPPASREFPSYVLPKPGDTSTILIRSQNPVSQTKLNPLQSKHYHHSFPLELNAYSNHVGTETLSEPFNLNSKSIIKESNDNQTPPPLTESFLMNQQKTQITYSCKKSKLQSFSSPLMSKSSSTKSSVSVSHPVVSSHIPKHSSGPITRGSAQQSSSSSRTSPTASPSFTPPRTSELHELPRPPVHSSSGKPSVIVGFSAPLVLQKPETFTASNTSVPKIASPLPPPPRVTSFSMPLMPHSRPSEGSPNSNKLKDLFSPPLTPVMSTNQHPI